MEELKKLYDAILNGNFKIARELTQQALDAGIDPQVLVQQQMIPAMDEVGRRYEANEYFVPELLISARAMKASLVIIRPLLVAQGAEPAGRVAIGTVKGDLHDIGKNLVAAMLEGAGFEVIDLGVDVSPDKFIAAVNEKNAGVIAMSALLTTTMNSMKTTVEAIKTAGVRGKVKIMIGGAPVTQKYADEIGADGYSTNANSAVALARKLVAASRFRTSTHGTAGMRPCRSPRAASSSTHDGSGPARTEPLACARAAALARQVRRHMTVQDQHARSRWHAPVPQPSRGKFVDT
jgi:corrinoid protein of di/trimethylamine methyltransferase